MVGVMPMPSRAFLIAGNDPAAIENESYITGKVNQFCIVAKSPGSKQVFITQDPIS